ncbi:hypothetical protein F183_A03270 [Bryobacterales bacterium F-183]|nr:hypothetical protein F183_A03270 [Bryobacterales bacterium F-183]
MARRWIDIKKTGSDRHGPLSGSSPKAKKGQIPQDPAPLKPFETLYRNSGLCAVAGSADQF